MKTRVFVVQETDHNILGARQWGELFVIFSKKDLRLSYYDMQSKLYKVMQTMRDTDYLLCIGDPVAIGLAIHVAIDITNGKFNILRWDRVKYDYRKEEFIIT